MVSGKGQHSRLPLSDFTEKLRTEYYESIGRLCMDVCERVEKIKVLDAASQNLGYLQQCCSVMSEIGAALNERKDKFVPYLSTLNEKVVTEHNCATCSGGCKLNHSMQLFDITNATKKLKDIQAELQLLPLPLYAETRFPDHYRVIHNLLALIESDLVELFFLEENYLIPKVIEAQKTINVFGR